MKRGKIASNNPASARRRHEQETIETETFPSTQEVHCLVDIIVWTWIRTVPKNNKNRGMLEHISQTTVKTLASLHETWIPEWGHHASQTHFKIKLAW